MIKRVALKSGLTILCLLASLSADAATVELQPVADTSLHEIFPENNFGAFPFVHAGLTGKDTRTRGLIRFDLTGAIPQGSAITSVTLQVSVVYVAPSVPVAEERFALHRMLTPWGEGSRNAGAGNGGRLAGDGEAAWNYARNPVGWDTPGGSPGVDFAAGASSEVAIGDVATYVFPSTPGLLADFRAWAEAPAANFGWILKSSGEAVAQSAKRFGSLESEAGAVLIIQYSLAGDEIRMTSIHVENGQVTLEWTGGTGPYQLQRRGTAGEGEWTDLGSPSAERQATTPLAGAEGYYRVRAGN